MLGASSWHSQEEPKIVEGRACSSILRATSSCVGHIGHLPMVRTTTDVHVDTGSAILRLAVPFHFLWPLVMVWFELPT